MPPPRRAERNAQAESPLKTQARRESTHELGCYAHAVGRECLASPKKPEGTSRAVAAERDALTRLMEGPPG